MWFKISSILLNIMLGIAAYFVLSYVLITGGFLDVSPTPSASGYLAMIGYVTLYVFVNMPFAKRATRGMLLHYLIHLPYVFIGFVGCLWLR